MTSLLHLREGRGCRELGGIRNKEKRGIWYTAFAKLFCNITLYMHYNVDREFPEDNDSNGSNINRMVYCKSQAKLKHSYYIES